MSADMAEKLRVQEHKVSTRSQRPVLVVASDSLGQSSASRKRPRADARQSDEPVVVTKILKRYGGTINLYKDVNAYYYGSAFKQVGSSKYQVGRYVTFSRSDRHAASDSLLAFAARFFRQASRCSFC